MLLVFTVLGFVGTKQGLPTPLGGVFFSKVSGFNISVSVGVLLLAIFFFPPNPQSFTSFEATKFNFSYIFRGGGEHKLQVFWEKIKIKIFGPKF